MRRVRAAAHAALALLLGASCAHGSPIGAGALASAEAALEAGDADGTLAALDRLSTGGDVDQLRLGALRVRALDLSGDLARAQGELERLRAIATTQGPGRPRAMLELAEARLLNGLGRREQALGHASRALAESGEDGGLRCAALAEAFEARRLGAGEPLEPATLDAAMTRCAAGGLANDIARLATTGARWRLATGDAAGALALLRGIATPPPDPAVAATLAAVRADALQRSGRLAEARQESDRALAFASRGANPLPLILAREARYEAALRDGDTASALQELQALDLAEQAYGEASADAQRAFEAGRTEALAREARLLQLELRANQLEQEARSAQADRALLRQALLAAGLLLALCLAWLLRARWLRGRMLRLLRTDGLTGLWTRSHFMERAEVVLAEAERRGEQLAFVLFDLDHFKAVNDRHGHAGGDRVLAAVAAALRRLESPGRRFGRLGGEEFAVLVPGASLEQGIDFAERCRAAIAALVVDGADGEPPVRPSASFGVVAAAVAGYRLRDLLSNADHALYRAKAAGRNRVAATAVARPAVPARSAAGLVALALGLLAPVTEAMAPAAGYAEAPTALFGRFDADRDGRVVEAEYVAYLGLGFRARDTDGNGVLEGEEQPAGAPALPRAAHEARLRRQFARQDANRDGALDARELLAPPRG